MRDGLPSRVFSVLAFIALATPVVAEVLQMWEARTKPRRRRSSSVCRPPAPGRGRGESPSPTAGLSVDGPPPGPVDGHGPLFSYSLRGDAQSTGWVRLVDPTGRQHAVAHAAFDGPLTLHHMSRRRDLTWRASGCVVSIFTVRRLSDSLPFPQRPMRDDGWPGRPGPPTGPPSI